MNEMTLLKEFEFAGSPLPVFEIEGKPYWIAKHVGKVLNYSEIGGELVKMISRDWSDEFVEGDDYVVLRGEMLKDFKRLARLGGKSPLTYVPSLMLFSESGVYQAAMLSRKPIGRRLRGWLKDEVLPSIARHGSYSIDNGVPPTHLQALKGWVAEMEKTQLLQGKIEKNRPKVEFAESIRQTKETVDVGEFAKLVNNMGIPMGRNRLFEKLRDLCIVMPDTTLPYQRYIDNGCFRVEEVIKFFGDKKKPILKTLITGKGQVFLEKKLRSQKALLENLIIEKKV